MPATAVYPRMLMVLFLSLCSEKYFRKVGVFSKVPSYLDRTSAKTYYRAPKAAPMTPKKSFLLGLICLFFGVLEPRTEAEKLIADYGGHAGFQSAVWVANDFKLFEKYGWTPKSS
jgi:hypothetical protein